MFKPILSIMLAAACATSVLLSGAFAQDVELQPNHPDQYVVVRGDTLWDISERFLQSPWLWPEIWDVNPQIENPHLIYPGDVINLVYVDGQPRLRVTRGERPTVTLSPHARRTSLSEAIAPIPISALRPYLDKRTILSRDEIDGLPYAVALQEEHVMAVAGQNIYVRDLDAQIGETYAVVRPTVVFMEVPDSFPWDRANKRPDTMRWSYPSERSISDYVQDFWKEYVTFKYHENVDVLGYEVLQTATAEVIATGDPTTLRLVSSDIEVQEGDLIVPVFTASYDTEYFPHRPDNIPDNTRVIALSQAIHGAGTYQVVALNKGWAQGIEHGDTFSVHRPGITIRDEVRYPKDDVKTYFSRDRRAKATVDLPDEYAAHIMVFKAYEDISYALIMRSDDVVKVLDIIKAP